MTDITNIPLNKLTAWEGNVRKTQNKATIDELAANIKADGLQQNLVVIKDGKGYAVVAGARRLAALNKLVKDGDLKSTFEVPCRITTEENASAISLAENTMRENMHPADECEAFTKLVEEGTPIPDVAARFGKTDRYVEQRIRLARGVSKKVMKAYREGKLTLAHVQAFTVTDDFKQQDEVFERFDPEYDDVAEIKDSLTSDDIPASHPRVRYVTLAAYEAAEGKLKRDLFGDEKDIYILDHQLLLKLATEKLQKAAKPVEKEGWKWIDVQPIRDSANYTLQRVYPKKGKWTKEQMSYAGAVITIGHDGKTEIERGLVRKEDMPKETKKANKLKNDGSDNDDPELQAQPGEKLSKRLEESLEEHYQVALAAHAIDHPRALLALVAYTASEELFGYGAELLEVGFGDMVLSHAEGTDTARKIAERRAAWGERLPGESDERRAWCFEQDTEVLIDLIAFCAAISIRRGRGASEARDLAKETRFDLTKYFTPTADNYFNHVGKEQINEAIADVKGTLPSGAAKKADMAKLAEQAVAGKGWLPKLLRPAA